MDNIEKIIKGCLSGKRDAQRDLYTLFADKMFGLCIYYTNNRTEADDILHEGFMKVFKNIDKFKNLGAFEGWMRRIFINTALEKFRKKRLLYPITDINEYKEECYKDDIISNISSKEIMSIVAQLSPKYKLVFNLFAIEGYTHKEIANLLGISEGTSKSNLARARVILQKKIKKIFFISEEKKQYVEC